MGASTRSGATEEGGDGGSEEGARGRSGRSPEADVPSAADPSPAPLPSRSLRPRPRVPRSRATVAGALGPEGPGKP